MTSRVSDRRKRTLRPTYSWNRLGTAEVLGPHAPSAFSCILGSAKEAMMDVEGNRRGILQQDNRSERTVTLTDHSFSGQAAQKEARHRAGASRVGRIFATSLWMAWYGWHGMDIQLSTLLNGHAICGRSWSAGPRRVDGTHASLRIPKTELAIIRCSTELLPAFN